MLTALHPKESQIIESKFITTTKKGTQLLSPVTMERHNGRIKFLQSAFSLKDEIKAMAGAKWHGYDTPSQMVWSIDDSPRNWFQIDWLEGGNPYEWYERPLTIHKYDRPLMTHQRELADSGLTYHQQVFAAEMSVGKTLSAIEIIEKSGKRRWWWVGPKTTLFAIRREFIKWGLDTSIDVKIMTYDEMVKLATETDELPEGIVFDESSKLKTAKVQRTNAAQALTDRMRAMYGSDAYIILMSGTPSPKSPVDIWAQAEIACPGFLREGSPKALEQRLAIMQLSGGAGMNGHYSERLAWRDNELRCNVCGRFEYEGAHDRLTCEDPMEFHKFVPSVNEVALMFERLKGLVIVKWKKDCVDLPKKIFQRVYLPPTPKLVRVAKSVVNTAKNTVTGLTQLRQLSDGFMYRDIQHGDKPCPICSGNKEIPEWYDPTEPDRTFRAIDMFSEEIVSKLRKKMITCPKCEGEGTVPNYVREAVEVPCPKQDALIEWLGKAEDHGRICVFAGFQGSVDRCVRICLKQGWDVFKVDGRGSRILACSGPAGSGESTQVAVDNPLDYWADLKANKKVAFVANPETGGFGLTLIEAKISVYWSNSYKPEYRVQSADRTHRPGQDQDVTIVDLIHLPSDERVLEILDDNRKLEMMLLGDIVGDSLEVPPTNEDEDPPF